jgi:hypothetical protein
LTILKLESQNIFLLYKTVEPSSILNQSIFWMVNQDGCQNIWKPDKFIEPI